MTVAAESTQEAPDDCSREVIPPEGTTWDDLPAIKPGVEDWPWWRGPTSDNKAAEPQNPPTHWSERENVVWKADVPGRGHGSPCIWGNRIFLATADDKAQVQSLLCYDRGNGKLLWQTPIHRGGFMHIHPKNSHASSTAACDGQRLFITFMVQQGIWLTTLDLDGHILQQKKVLPFTSMHGFGPSPLLYKSLVIVPGDNPGPNYLAALRRDNGEIAWRIHRTDYQSFASHTVAHVAGRDQLLVNGPLEVSSYDPSTGKRLWHCEGPSKEAASTIVAGTDVVYGSAGYPTKSVLCIRADGSGDVTKSHVLWRYKGKAAFVPTPLLHEELLYVADDAGLLMCLDAKTGELAWSKRLEGGFSASPVLAGGNIYLPNEAGLMYVFKPGRSYQQIAANDLHDGGFATPAICGSRIYLRTLHQLHCIGIGGK
jgi:outer membrane protein assembly factor BamB